jgi:hypothetical protein
MPWPAPLHPINSSTCHHRTRPSPCASAQAHHNCAPPLPFAFGETSRSSYIFVRR